jgi:hypothetical protein
MKSLVNLFMVLLLLAGVCGVLLNNTLHMAEERDRLIQELEAAEKEVNQLREKEAERESQLSEAGKVCNTPDPATDPKGTVSFPTHLSHRVVLVLLVLITPVGVGVTFVVRNWCVRRADDREVF